MRAVRALEGRRRLPLSFSSWASWRAGPAAAAASVSWEALRPVCEGWGEKGVMNGTVDCKVAIAFASRRFSGTGCAAGAGPEVENSDELGRAAGARCGFVKEVEIFIAWRPAFLDSRVRNDITQGYATLNTKPSTSDEQQVSFQRFVPCNRIFESAVCACALLLVKRLACRTLSRRRPPISAIAAPPTHTNNNTEGLSGRDPMP